MLTEAGKGGVFAGIFVHPIAVISVEYYTFCIEYIIIPQQQPIEPVKMSPAEEEVMSLVTEGHLGMSCLHMYTTMLWKFMVKFPITVDPPKPRSFLSRNQDQVKKLLASSRRGTIKSIGAYFKTIPTSRS